MIDRIDALLPQTQCCRCGFDGCRPYAEALESGSVDCNRCPPGGQRTADALSALLGIEASPLDQTRGGPEQFPRARIIESLCIGCTLCIQACPVDAIIGTAKRMHTVIGDECTGCELCVPPCPVDCIVLDADPRAWSAQDAAAARERHARRTRRSGRNRDEPTVAGMRGDIAAAETPSVEARRAAVAAALVRARSRRSST